MRSFAFAMIALAIAASAPGTTLARGSSEDEVRRLQQVYFEKIKAKDASAAADLLSEDYTGVYADGVIGRDAEAKDLIAFSNVLAAYSISDETVKISNKVTAVVTFRLHVKVIAGGNEINEDDNIICVWKREKHTWKLAAQAAVKAKVQKAN